MITVITGMEVHPFNRLLEAIDHAVASGTIKDNVFVQRGHTPYQPKNVPFEDFISFGELCEKIEASEVVITHAGAGATLTCLQCQRRPISVPRQHKYGEHIDDHQLPFSQRLHDFGLVHQVLEMDELVPAIQTAREQQSFSHDGTKASSGIVQFLDDFWADKVAKKQLKP